MAGPRANGSRRHSAARRRSISRAPALIRGMSSRPNSIVSFKGSNPRMRKEATPSVEYLRIASATCSGVAFLRNSLAVGLGRAAKGRGVAERAGRGRDRHPQPLVMDIALHGEAHQPLPGIVDRALGLLLQAPALLAGHGGEDAVGLVPRLAFARRDDRA